MSITNFQRIFTGTHGGCGCGCGCHSCGGHVGPTGGGFGTETGGMMNWDHGCNCGPGHSDCGGCGCGCGGCGANGATGATGGYKRDGVKKEKKSESKIIHL